MTILSIRCHSNLLRDYRSWMAAATAFLFATLVAVALSSGSPTLPGPRAQPIMQSAALVAATSGKASIDYQAVGEQAKLINANLPYNAGPVDPAKPFTAPRAGTDYERALLCLTQAVYYEAGFEPVAGRRAVAQVVLNRMRHAAFPNSICGVVYQGSTSPVCQFSFVCDGALNRIPAAAGWRQAGEVARAALAGYVEASVGSSTHYHADYVSPRWAPLLAKVNKIGAHIFYRWPGGWGLPGAFASRYIGEPNDPATMRPALLGVKSTSPVPEVASASLAAGPPVRRSPNDVGGLLDTSKGWTLSIPSPTESQSAAARILAQQNSSKTPGTAAVLATAAPLLAPK